MGRLIDADALISFIDAGHLRHPGELCFSELDVVNMLNHAPTAYDVEKVIEDLSSNSRFIDDINEHNIKCISCVIGQKTAIEIVLKGGVE